MEDRLYWYQARLVRVIDGDTIVVDLDLGCSIWLTEEHIRLSGINAPELHGKSVQSGYAAMERLKQLLPAPGSMVLLHTHKDKRGSFQRLLADVYIGNVNVNRRMVEEGYAVKFK